MQLALVVQYVQMMLGTCGITEDLRVLLMQLLAQRGRILHPDSTGEWPTIVLEICQAFDGDPAAAVIAASAIECATAAVDVIDDLLDEEWAPGAEEPRRRLNASMALSLLAQHCLHNLPALISIERAQRVDAFLVQGLLSTCIGQDLDVLQETDARSDAELAYAITQRKSGALVAAACQIGAALATDDAVILALIGRFGFHVGITAQLLNDIAGVDPNVPDRGSDLRLRKKTLPVAYALRCAAEEGISALLTWSTSTTPITSADEQQIAITICNLGALHYTWIIADAHRREALSVVRQLAQTTQRQQVAHLRRLIPKVRARRV